ncbi:PAS domain-containing sensor histidine kinase [Hyalangium sp.]|uniref:PAS domain-containing sensor histidine kinase n=1 Tax=Hyalangium sp. TaxID=2028555 RepID=UPI002D3744EB|nr:ATP-binding protein [Hyalangium sp.]HYH97522.1 ATP-binding protein [Hyalangium sp.]
MLPPEADELKLLIEAVADPLVACDGQERIVHLTRSAERLLGWKDEELRGQPFTTLIPQRLHTVGGGSLLHYLLERQQQQAGQPTLLPLQRRGGEELLLEMTAGHASEGPHERITLSLRRVPEAPSFIPEALEREASLKLQRHGHLGAARRRGVAGRLYRLIVENAPLGIFLFDTTPAITTCNDYFVRIIGSSKRLLIGLNLLTLRDPRIMRCIRATLGGEHAHYEGDYTSVTARKVTPVRIHFAPCYNELGQVAGGVGLVEDVTVQRRIEEERATQTMLVDSLLRTAPIGMAFLDPQLRYVRINDVLARINGHPPEEHIGRKPHEVLGAGGTRLEQLLQTVLDSSSPLEQLEMSSEDFGKPGQTRYWIASLYPVPGSDGRLMGVGAVVEDFTERRLAEQERTRLFREAQEAVRVRDDFLTVASHELKTPLTPLSLRLANLERRLERGEPVDPSALRHARQHLLRLTTLINDLLDASRIESGGLALRPQPLQLDVLIEHVIQVTEGLYNARHRIHFHSSTTTPLQVRGDPYRLEQVVTNLLENALKYSPSGGTVHVSLEQRGDMALLSVRDPGIGIPADQQQHLFERYFRARNVSTDSYGGLGLGLYICRDIVERHEGRIWVESEVDRGSTFYVALPTLQKAKAPLEQAPDHAVH